jgi:TRAP-type C4-dicarboxylate transport system permease small subunit
LSQAENTFSRLEKAGRAGEDAVLVIILGGMILLAAAQIVMRNFLNVGVIWGDELLRMLVLWIALAGAVAASRSDKHINIAILDRFLPEKIKIAVKAIIHLFTAVVCGTVTWHSVKFVQTSHEFGDVLMGSIPAWIPQLILPVGFGLICYRYSLFVIKEFIRLARAGQAE